MQWQTPPRGQFDWQSSYQDYRELTGYADYLYAADRKSARVSVLANSRQGLALQYSFGGAAFQSASSTTLSSSYTGGLVVVVKDSKGNTLTLDREFSSQLVHALDADMCRSIVLSMGCSRC